jgi:transcriptional regulator of acetoin/glycerol metabolism
MRDQTGDLLTAMAGSQTLAADILRASWNRCLSEYKLDRALKKPIARIAESTVRELRTEMEEVLIESSPIVDRVRRVARDANYVVLFSDANGVVIESHADSAEGQEVAMEGLVKGSVWRENLVGTNGIGTCLISRNPITVNGNAHFNETFRNYTCSAAPIHGPDGRIVAVLDISGRATLDASSYNFAQHFTREAASQIGILLFRKWHKNDCIIALSDQPDPMPLGLKALLATDERGRILGATQEALNQLGVPELSDLGGRSISDLWHVSLDDLKPLHSHNVRLNMNNGASTYATAFVPRRKSVSAPARALRPSDKRASSGSSARPLDRIAGADPQVIQCVELCRKIIDKDIPLLILGETGAGKDTLARAIHDESARADRPFVAVNCAAIPATLLASELFGYAPGTFTGGVKGGRVGKIAASHGGTLFLDEIGDMPLELQAHLLRVLEERSVTPLGSTESVPVDMKIICATHRNLTELVAKGSFRKDLYYRIKGVQITLPNLSQRTDLAEIAQKIAEEELGENRSGFAFSDEVLALFRRYPWPGNVRELKSVIRFITSIHGAKLITLEHLPEGLVDMTRSAPETAARAPITTFIPERREDGIGPSGSGQTLAEANEAGEMKRIVEALRASKWNVTEAASQLCVSRATLHRKIRKYRIMSPNNLG